jgi:hypothetical protein
MARSKRSLEGTDFELYAVPAALRNDGYEVNFSHRSHGAYDHAAWKTGEILLVAARLTGIGKTNPGFSSAELAPLWAAVVQHNAPGFTVRAILATAEHAPTWSTKFEAFGPCRCQPRVPVDELLADGVPAVRYLELTGPPVGRGQRPNWRPWTPDYGLDGELEVRGVPALVS